MSIIVILLLMLNKIRSSSLNIASILTEDLGSGFTNYSHCFPTSEAYTVHKNDNLIVKLRYIDKSK